ncbi:MAG: gliding motility lipoprotein GldH [Candidatus Limimorpha sp.]
MKTRYFISIVLIAVSVMTSCGRGAIYDESVVIPDAKWSLNNIPYFDVEVDDTLATYSFYLNIRHLENYRYSNLFIFMNTVFPNGNHTRDTIECTLALPDGRWLGKGSGTIRSAKVLLNPALRFPLKGNYHFEIEQAMRDDELKGVTDIGICFEKQ